MDTISALAQTASRGSQHELSYASPLVIRVRGDRPDRESLERHDSKRRSGGFNDEDGKLGDDGRKRRSWGSSDDGARLTQDNLHNEDLRVGGPYLCSIPTENIVVPTNHAKFRLTCLETDEGWALGQKILKVIDKYHLNQDGVSLRFSFLGRQSLIDPEPQPCLTLYIPANRGTVDDTWLQCARELRALLISNDFSACSVEIVDPMIFTPVNTYPVLQKDRVFWEWEPLLRELLAQLDLIPIRFIGCFRRGRGPTVLDCSPTVLLLVDRCQDWTQVREKVVSILKSRSLQMVAVEIVMDRLVHQTNRQGISTEVLEGLLKKDDPEKAGKTKAGDSIASSQNHDGSGTLGCFLDLKSPFSNEWGTFALTCWHVVVPPCDGLSDGEKQLIESWNKNGVQPDIANEDAGRLLCVDQPSRRAYTEEASKMEAELNTTRNGKQYRIWQELEREGALEDRRGYDRTTREITQQVDDIQILHDRFRNGDQVLGRVMFASGFKRKDLGLEKHGVKHSINLDWALVGVRNARQPSNRISRDFAAEEFAPRTICQSLEPHGTKVFMYGYRSGKRSGIYNGLRVADIQTEMKEGVVSAVPTLEYAIVGMHGEPFSTKGDSGAMIGWEREISRGTGGEPVTEKVIIGMVIAGHEKERITLFTRMDVLLDDIKEMTNAGECKAFLSA